jgi:diacylglycerol kinase (ATP)
MWVAPEARIDDGLLDVIVIKGMPVSSILRHLPKLYNGRISRVPGVLRGVARSVRALRPKGLGLDIDGESLGCLPADVMILPRAITILGHG